MTGKYSARFVLQIFLLQIKVFSDIKEHLNTQKHKANSKGQASRSNIQAFFEKTRPSSEENLIRAAEGAMAYHSQSPHVIQFFGL